MADKKRLDLPFVRRRSDMGSAVWNHRAGIYAVLALVFVVAAVFIGSKIVIRTPQNTDGILIDLRTAEELEKEQRRAENEVRMRRLRDDPDAWARNVVSNQAAHLQQVSDTKTAAAASHASALDANRDAYNEGMRQVADMRSSAASAAGETGASGARQTGDLRAKGRVLVSFLLVQPVRQSDWLEIPGYRCEGGGEVVVDVVVNPSGSVVSAAVNRARSRNDECMHTTAVAAARRSRFRPDTGAPERQAGTITYSFIPQ